MSFQRMDIIIIYLHICCKSQNILTVISYHLTDDRELQFVRLISVNFRDAISEAQCQILNVRDSVSEYQWQRLTIKDSISKLDVLTWFHFFAIPQCWMSSVISVYMRLLHISYGVFHPWISAKSSVNVNW
jgi:hypothetical protein